MLVYLAGAISWYVHNNKYDECLRWRKSITEKLNALGIECFDACVNVENNVTYNHISNVKQNLYYLGKTDLVVVNTDHLIESSGTIFELAYCYLNHKPVIGLGIDERIPTYRHISVCIDQCLQDEDEVIKYIKSLYSFSLKK
jgi:nucleoside 2-deoxyribosyltransferase